MLTKSTFESFRVTTLDVVSRIDELSRLVGEVERSRMPLATLRSSLDETAWSLSSDPVASLLAADEVSRFAEYAKTADNNLQLSFLNGYCRLLTKRVSDHYKGTLEAAIQQEYADPNRRDALRNLCAAYCSHLVNIGFSKKFLLRTVNERFFGDDIKKVETRTLQRFFARFSGADKHFRVWVSAGSTTANFVAKLSLPKISIQHVSDLPPDVKGAFWNREGFSTRDKYILADVMAKDTYGAVASMNSTLGSIESLMILGRSGLDLHWNTEAYVRTPRSETGEFTKADPFVLQSATALRGNSAQIIRANSRKALSSFDEKSTERLLSAVNTAALARTSPNLENHLISLWSAIEVLLSDPPPGTPRIVHYVNLLTPCICIKYVRRYIVAVYNEISKYHSKECRLIIGNMALPSDVDEYTRFTHLVFDPGFINEQAALLAAMSDNPLGLHRLWKLQNNFASPQSYRASIVGHEKRVSWQLNRIYQTRNQLVHSGSVPVYLEPLVLNMLEYFRSTVGPIIGRASREDGESNIDQLVTEIGVDFDITKRRVKVLQGQDLFSVDQYPKFFR